jgi:hypothetical protein
VPLGLSLAFLKIEYVLQLLLLFFCCFFLSNDAPNVISMPAVDDREMQPNVPTPLPEDLPLFGPK